MQGVGGGEVRLQPFLKGRVSIYKGPFYPLVISSANTSQAPTPCQVTRVQINPIITKTGLLTVAKYHQSLWLGPSLVFVHLPNNPDRRRSSNLVLIFSIPTP